MGPAFHISAAELSARVGAPDAPRVIDICLPEDHALDPRVIPGACRIGFEEAAQLEETKPIVVACQKGFKLSQGVAALLRHRGNPARYLEGGMVGWAARALPLIKTEMHPCVGKAGSRWVLPEEPGAGDVINAWCVKRFVDRSPVWMQVAPDQTDLVADRFGAHDPGNLTSILRTEIPHLTRQIEQFSDEKLLGLLAGACRLDADSTGGMSGAFAVLDAGWSSIRAEVRV